MPIDTIANYKELGYAIALQAIKDFFHTSLERGRAEIIKDLRAPHMRLFTNELSAMLADKLETDPESVKEAIKRMEE